MDMQQQVISFQTGLMRALETATVAATAARGAADAAQGSGRPSGPPEPASVPNVRFGQSTNRIHPIKESHDEALKYFEKQALLHERNVQHCARTQKEIDRLTSVISAMEQSKNNELKFIYPPGTFPFKAPSDVAEMNEPLLESLENVYVLSFTSPKGSSRRNAMNISHHASNTFIGKATLQAQTAHLASVKALSWKQVFLESCASPKFRQQEWHDLGLEDVDRQGVDPKAAEHHALEIYLKNDRQGASKSCCRGKNDDLKKKEVSKKTRGRKAWKSFGFSCQKKSSKKSKVTPTWRSRLTTKKVSRISWRLPTILPQESVLEKELTKTKSTRVKGKEIPSKKKHRRPKARAREIPSVIHVGIYTSRSGVRLCWTIRGTPTFSCWKKSWTHSFHCQDKAN